MVEHWFDSIDCLDLPILDLGQSSNITYNDMLDIRCQGIAVDDVNDPNPENFPD